MNGKALVKKTFRTLLAADTDDFNRGILLAMLEARVCPTEFPELGVEDCRPARPGEHTEQHCRNCWISAIATKTDGYSIFD